MNNNNNNNEIDKRVNVFDDNRLQSIWNDIKNDKSISLTALDGIKFFIWIFIKIKIKKIKIYILSFVSMIKKLKNIIFCCVELQIKKIQLIIF